LLFQHHAHQLPKKIDPLSYFPLSVAREEAFCNRKDEIKLLQAYIESCRPVLLVSPRRYGKTSLAFKAIKKSRLPYVHVDLFSAVDEHDVEKAILSGVQGLINQLETLPKKAFNLASELFSGTHIKVVLSKFGLEMEASKDREKAAYRVLDILERLEKLSTKTNKRIVLFFDEFQVIREIENTRAMEAVLRQVAQLTKTISFVFSGSHRHLLNELFDDRERPFYKLCERITLERISESAYKKHIQSVAQLYWKKSLGERELEKIFTLSERHPYYLNLLCARLFISGLPTTEVIDKIWIKHAIEERSQVASEMELLSKNQKKLLIAFARNGGTNEPLGQNFVRNANMAKASIEQALKFLFKKDYVYTDESGHIDILDPLIKTVLSWDGTQGITESNFK